MTTENEGRVVDDTHCKACGQYMPLTLSGAARVHDCDRTPPLDNLPTTIYACPTCGGHGAHPWGCWGTNERPHEHAYMKPVHELARVPKQELTQAEERVRVLAAKARAVSDELRRKFPRGFPGGGKKALPGLSLYTVWNELDQALEALSPAPEPEGEERSSDG